MVWLPHCLRGPMAERIAGNGECRPELTVQCVTGLLIFMHIQTFHIRILPKFTFYLP